MVGKWEKLWEVSMPNQIVALSAPH